MTDAVDQAKNFLRRFKSQGNPPTVNRGRNWQGQDYSWQEPVVGSCFKGTGAPAVDKSEWVQVQDETGDTYTVRVA